MINKFNNILIDNKADLIKAYGGVELIDNEAIASEALHNMNDYLYNSEISNHEKKFRDGTFNNIDINDMLKVLNKIDIKNYDELDRRIYFINNYSTLIDDTILILNMEA